MFCMRQESNMFCSGLRVYILLNTKKNSAEINFKKCNKNVNNGKGINFRKAQTPDFVEIMYTYVF